MHERNNWSNLVSGANLLRGSAHSQFPIQVSSVRKFGQNMGGVQDKERQGQVKFFLQNTSFLLSCPPPPTPTPRGKEMSLSRCIGLYYKLPKSDPYAVY